MAAPTLAESIRPRAGGAEESEPALYLFAVGPSGSVEIKLPTKGSVLVGRDEDADVRIVDPRASRRHAIVHVDDGLEIEDLRSANGTWVRDDRLPSGSRVRFLPGEVIGIGASVMMVQRRAAAVKTRVQWPHAYLEIRVIEECARAAKARATFGYARIDIDDGGASQAALEVLTGVLRSGDMVAAYGPKQFEVLLPDTSPAQAKELLDRLSASLRDSVTGARTGLAIYPTDAASPQQLFAVATQRVLGADPSTGGVVLVSPSMRELYALASRVAAGTINILITGETGAGKEVLAKHVHAASPRAGKPFVAINCGALAETLLESELFGHERGAFTGAVQSKEGLLEVAREGTLFLDEVGEMPPALQTKLLRVLETRQLVRVGGTKPRQLDVRIVAATNRDLEDDVTNRTFRQDLYFRLAGVTLNLPPLRERVEEIEPLARLFLDTVARQLGRPAPMLDVEALELLEGYSWPGNIRELKNVIERAVLLAADDRIGLDQMPASKMQRAIARVAGNGKAPGPGEEGSSAWREHIVAIEKQAMLDALARCEGNKTRAAEIMGMGRSTFFARAREYGIGR